MRACFICPDTTPDPYFVIDGYHYLRCPNCGLLYVDRIAEWDTLYHSYDGGFLKSFRRKMLLPFRKFHHYPKFNYKMKRARSIVSFIREHRPELGKGTAFFDVGCNKGFLLAAAVEQEWNIHGVEVVNEILVPFRKEYKDFADQVITGKPSDVKTIFDKEFFDVITAIDVIEHFEDPFKDMQLIHSLLKPGGAFVLQTPDAESPEARSRGERWGALKPLEHLHIFGSQSLKALATQLGYQSVSIHKSFDENVGNLVAVLTK